MANRPFHHGNLREVLLALAGEALQAGGLEQLSMRELARQAGVTNAAPRRHFADRRALLDALAADGFRRLTAEMTAASKGAGPYQERFRAVAEVFVNFATANVALLELMFLSKNNSSEELREEAKRFFQANNAFYATALPEDTRAGDDNARRQRLLVPTLQGIATLAASGRISGDHVQTLLDDTAALLA